MKIDLFAEAIRIKFLWVGYVIEKQYDEIYYDNCKVSNSLISEKVIYSTIGFSKKAVLKRVCKKAKKIYGWYRKGNDL